MKVNQTIHRYLLKLKSLPLKKRIGIGLGGFMAVLVLSMGLLFFIPKTVQFSYAGQTCVSHFTFLPALQKTSSSDFALTPHDAVSIGAWPVFATKLCAEPTKAPKEGNYKATLSLFGGPLGARQFAVNVPSLPRINAQGLEGKAISTVLPLKMELSDSDTIHSYTIQAEGKTSGCSVKGTSLSCETSALGLAQGESYDLTLTRSYKNASPQTLVQGAVTTLSPLNITNAPFPDKTTVYDMPKAFSFTFDKPLASAQVTLKTDKGEVIPTTVTTDAATLTLSLTTDLPRKSSYTLTLDRVVALEGNTLESPLVLPFSTSGGPKVSEVSVGGSGVGQNAQIIVTFDQPINENTDIAAVARVGGVVGSVRKLSDTKVGFQLNGASLCAAFTLTIDKGVKSGSNNETSEAAWQFNSRTVCGVSATIGYSVKGRPITAHYFGNGSNTLLFTGGIHGSERSGQATMQAWVDYLMQNAYKIPADKRIVVVPNTNPDGIAAGSRNNANNVNVDRNFPAANWSSQIDTASGVLPNGGGTSPGSEPEAKALLTLTRQLKPRLSISFHAQGRLVGANQVGDSVAIGSAYAHAVGYGTMYGNAEEVMGYTITGEYEDWMGEELGTPAILIELPTPSGNYLNSQMTALLQLLTI